MKKATKVLAVIFILTIIPACHYNRLKSDEKQLAQKILMQEKNKADSFKAAMTDISGKRSMAIRLKENRSVDPKSPPVRIDVMGSISNTKEFKLSDVASSVRYVKLQKPADTTLTYDPFYYRDGLDSRIRSDDNQIIFEGLFGVTRFSMDGEYQETIWKNNTGIRFFGTKSVAFGGQDFFGIPYNIPVNISNGNLIYAFKDGPGENWQIMRYQTGNNKISIQPKKEVIPNDIIPGNIVYSHHTSTFGPFSNIYLTGPDTWVSLNTNWDSGTSGTLMVSLNNAGDTVCRFTDFNRIKNFNNSSYRPFEMTSYQYNGTLSIKQAYNDTVFRLVSPERLKPQYTIDFGKFEFSQNDGLNPNFDLSDKFMLNSLFENDNFLFIQYTQNHDGVLARKKQAVKFYNSIYSKKEDILYHIPGFSFLPEGLINDLDGGFPFWPEFITPQGEMMKLVSGRVLKDYFNSEKFKKAPISPENRRKQIAMAAGLKPTDMIIIIVK
jgi:hypothetical protein